MVFSLQLEERSSDCHGKVSVSYVEYRRLFPGGYDWIAGCW